MKIVFVCRGNVGRSQMAEALLRKMKPDLTITSAGTTVVNAPSGDKSGVALDSFDGGRMVIEVLKEARADASHKTRVQLTEEMLTDADRIIVMAEKDKIPDYLLNDPRMIYWQLADPMKTSIEGHRATRDEIQKLLENNIALFTA